MDGRGTEANEISIVRNRDSYCWRSSLKIFFVVEAYSFCRNERLLRVSLLFHDALPIVEEKENTVALKRDRDETQTTRAIQSFGILSYNHGMGFVNDIMIT